ncbi:MAG: PQQ-dependent sugar dehydrogenase [Planctomycetota bacterium]|jgi:glucose/arabinose dehydrogenase
MPGRVLALLAWLSAAAAGQGPAPLADPLPDLPLGAEVVRLEPLVSGLAFPTDAAVPPDGSPRLFVTRLDGKLFIVEDGVLLPTRFADLSATFEPGIGSAMSSLAFHPDFATNRRLYVVMSELQDPALADFGATDGVVLQSVLYELVAMADYPAPGANLADETATRELLRINEQSLIHNLDELTFGPDGYLYASKGDDETGGQDLTTVHGAVLRLDVDLLPGNAPSANGQYAVPADNPFVGAGGGVVEEIWAHGFRNPWRMAFDAATGELWLADVGQADVEEIDRVVAGGNHGWDHKEGGFAYLAPGVSDDLSGLPSIAFVDPVAQYDHGEQDLSISGGVLYRGTALPTLAGHYVCGDWKSGRLLAADPATGAMRVLPVDPNGETVHGQLAGAPVEGVLGVVEDADGELLVIVTRRDLSSTARLLRVAPGTWADLGQALAGAAGEPALSGVGDLSPDSRVTLSVSGSVPSAPATLVFGLAELGAGFKGGVMVPGVEFLLPLTLDAAGSLQLSAPWPRDVPAQTRLYLQCWMSDAAGPQGYAATNALRATTP